VQADLEQQKALVCTLKTDLEKTVSLKAELERATAMALQLAEGNARLTQELEALKQPAATQPAQRSPDSNAALTTKTASTTKEAMQRRQAQMLAHPIFPSGALPSQLSNPDMGWVD